MKIQFGILADKLSDLILLRCQTIDLKFSSNLNQNKIGASTAVVSLDKRFKIARLYLSFSVR